MYYFVVKPRLKDLTILRYIEGTENITFNIEYHRPYPLPINVTWLKDGIPAVNDAKVIFGYPFFHFEKILRNDSGLYSVHVTNYYVNGPIREIGRTVLTFTIDVLCEYVILKQSILYHAYYSLILDGPEFETQDTLERVVQLDHPMSLVCGTNIISNPQPTVIWNSPLGIVVPSSNAILFNDSSIIGLNVTRLNHDHKGIWTCIVKVSIENEVVLNGDTEYPFVIVGVKVVHFVINLISKLTYIMHGH